MVHKSQSARKMCVVADSHIRGLHPSLRFSTIPRRYLDRISVAYVVPLCVPYCFVLMVDRVRLSCIHRLIVVLFQILVASSRMVTLPQGNRTRTFSADFCTSLPLRWDLVRLGQSLPEPIMSSWGTIEYLRKQHSKVHGDSLLHYRRLLPVLDFLLNQ